MNKDRCVLLSKRGKLDMWWCLRCLRVWHVGGMLVACWWHVGGMLVVCWWYVGGMLVARNVSARYSAHSLNIMIVRVREFQ
jgi:hypothetical protein